MLLQLTRSPTFSSHTASRSGNTFSPPTITQRSDAGQGSWEEDNSDAQKCQYAVGRSTTVTRRRSSQAKKSASESVACGVRNTSVAPTSSVGNISSAAVSKLIEANWRTRSLGRSP